MQASRIRARDGAQRPHSAKNMTTLPPRPPSYKRPKSAVVAHRPADPSTLPSKVGWVLAESFVSKCLPYEANAIINAWFGYNKWFSYFRRANNIIVLASENRCHWHQLRSFGIFRNEYYRCNYVLLKVGTCRWNDASHSGFYSVAFLLLFFFFFCCVFFFTKQPEVLNLEVKTIQCSKQWILLIICGFFCG